MRVVDGSVLRLIEQWRNAPVEETDEGGRKHRRRNARGTPQGGVICQRRRAVLRTKAPPFGYLAPLGSPLLANIYLHWFDHVFHAADGPARKAGAALVRYADDFVVLARSAGENLGEFIEKKIEGWLGLKINREKNPGSEPARAGRLPGVPWLQLPVGSG
jgi:RNA-directed DNA polymerase